MKTLNIILCITFLLFIYAEAAAADAKKIRYKADELTPVRVNRLYGYINEKGKMLIEPRFGSAGYFSDDLALVQLDGWGFIDLAGEPVIGLGKPAPGDAYDDFTEGFAPFEKDRKWGFMDKNGAVVIEPVYRTVHCFSEGFALVSPYNKQGGSSGKYGYIDTSGKVVVEPIYNEALDYSDGMGAVNLAGIHGNWGYVNTKGKVVIEPQFHRAFSFHDGLARAMPADGGGFGLINKKGKYVFSYVENVGNQQNGGFQIQISSKNWYTTVDSNSGIAPIGLNGDWFFANAKGKKYKIPVQCTFIKPFSEGLAAYRDKNGKQGYLNKKGKIAVKPEYDEAMPFKNGLAEVHKAAERMLINKRGKIVWKIER